MLNGLLFFSQLERLDREVRLFRAVETGDHRIKLLTNLKAIRTLLVTVTAQVGALDEASCAIFACLYFKSAIAHFKNGHGGGATLLQAACRSSAGCRWGTLFKLLDAKRNALFLGVDVENDCLDGFALAMKVQGLFAGDAPCDVGHVDHAVNVTVETNEQTKFGRILDFAFNGRTNRELVGERCPWIVVRLLEAKRNAAFFHVDVENDNVDFL